MNIQSGFFAFEQMDWFADIDEAFIGSEDLILKEIGISTIKSMVAAISNNNQISQEIVNEQRRTYLFWVDWGL